MQYGKDAAVAKLLVGEGPAHAGMAIVVGRRHVMTCAHVVNTAIGRPVRTTMEPKGEELSVVFPLSMTGAVIDGTVVAWRPMGKSLVGDVAVIALDCDVPSDVGIAIFAQVHRPRVDDPLTVFGAVAGQVVGNHVTATFVGHATGAQVQIAGKSTPEIFVQGGFSGAAVWSAVHQAVVGMVTAINIGSATPVAYMAPTAVLRTIWPDLLVEERRLPRSFNMIWTVLTGAFFASLLWLFLVQRHPAPSDHPQLIAFWGMHIYAFVAPFVGWLWYRYVKDFQLHPWSAKIPDFANIRTDPNSTAEKTVWIASVIFLFVLPLYAQGHFIRIFNTQGYVYVYPDIFGLDEAQLRRAGACATRSLTLCTHADAGRYSLVTPIPPAQGGFWNNAYHYGDYNRTEAPNRSVTFFPILQPVIVIALTALAVLIHVAMFFRMFRRRADHVTASTTQPPTCAEQARGPQER